MIERERSNFVPVGSRIYGYALWKKINGFTGIINCFFSHKLIVVSIMGSDPTYFKWCGALKKDLGFSPVDRVETIPHKERKWLASS